MEDRQQRDQLAGHHRLDRSGVGRRGRCRAIEFADRLAGTGEQANARSSYSGKGLFKSIDGGATWQFMGLPDSHHIARIVIHPKNPDTVWVAVMGHLFSRNEERGVYRTTNGGKSWQKVLYVDDGTGRPIS